MGRPFCFWRRRRRKKRRGKAIVAFCRLDDKPIRLRSRVKQPDYVVVQDPTTLGELDVTQGLKPEGPFLINTRREPRELGLPSWMCVHTLHKVQEINGYLWRSLPNTFLLGAFSAITKELTLQAVTRAVRKSFLGKVGEENSRMVQQSFKQFKGEGS